MANDPETAAETRGLDLSEAAVQRLKTLIATTPGPPVAGIQIRIVRRTTAGFEHQLVMVDEGREPKGDPNFEVDGLSMYVEESNAEYLLGTAIDYENRGEGVNGFDFKNPNPLWHNPVAMRIQELFDSSINPSIASHGGYVDLLGVEGKIAYVGLGGGCQGCGMADVTLKQGIAVAIKDFVPEIEQVIDETDHDSGENPFYQPAKK